MKRYFILLSSLMIDSISIQAQVSLTAERNGIRNGDIIMKQRTAPLLWNDEEESASGASNAPRRARETMPKGYSDYTDYCANIVYDWENAIVLNPEGYAVVSQGGNATFHYYLRDHLGSNRVVFTPQDSIEQVNHYYAWGGLMDISSNEDAQRYRFCGKELLRDNGIDWYDHGARWYDATLPTWHSMDPLCESYYNISPFVYCAGNPINLKDLDGRKFVFTNGTTDSFKESFYKAINLLNTKGCGDLYNLIESVSINIYIIEKYDIEDGNYFDSTKESLFWNPHRGIKTTNEIFLSPTTLLNHELDHISEYLFNNSQYNINSKDDDKNLYTNKEEERVIKGSEQKTAKALGEIRDGETTRTDHSGFAFETNDPTSNKPLNESHDDEFVIYGQKANKQ